MIKDREMGVVLARVCVALRVPEAQGSDVIPSVPVHVTLLQPEPLLQ